METRHFDAYARMKEKLIRKARHAAQNALSYRNFHVGCAVLAWNGRAYRTFLGANMKPAKDGPKTCAEQVAVGSARARGYRLIVAIVVVGEPQPDDTSKVETATLHPCWLCRTIFRNIPEVTDDTVVLTVANHDAARREENRFGDLVALHESPHS